MRHASNTRKRKMLVQEMEKERKRWVWQSIMLKLIIVLCAISGYRADRYAGWFIMSGTLHWRMVRAYREHRMSMQWLREDDQDSADEL
jgi:hypothetical protein